MNAKKALEKAMKRHDELEPWLHMVFSDVREAIESTPLRVWWGHVQQARVVAAGPDADLLVFTVVVPFRRLEEDEKEEVDALNDDIILLVAPPDTATRQAVNEAVRLLTRRLSKRRKAGGRRGSQAPPYVS